MNRQDRY